MEECGILDIDDEVHVTISLWFSTGGDRFMEQHFFSQISYLG